MEMSIIIRRPRLQQGERVGGEITSSKCPFRKQRCAAQAVARGQGPWTRAVQDESQLQEGKQIEGWELAVQNGR